MPRKIILFLSIVLIFLSCGIKSNVLPTKPHEDVITEENNSFFDVLDISEMPNTTNNLITDEPHAESAAELRYGPPIGMALTESERKYYGDALVNAINNQNYYYGEYSFKWPLNGIGKSKVEVYKSEYRVTFIFLNSTVGNQRDSYYFQKECYFSVGLAIDEYGMLAQISQSGYCQPDVEGLRAELIANNLHWEHPWIYLCTIEVDIPPVYPPDNPDLFSYICDIIDYIRVHDVGSFTLYTGLQDRSYHSKDGSDEILWREEIEYCVVIGEEKYFGRCVYTPGFPFMEISPESQLPFEPQNKIEAYRMEQIFKLGKKYEIVE